MPFTYCVIFLWVYVTLTAIIDFSIPKKNYNISLKELILGAVMLLSNYLIEIISGLLALYYFNAK